MTGYIGGGIIGNEHGALDCLMKLGKQRESAGQVAIDAVCGGHRRLVAIRGAG